MKSDWKASEVTFVLKMYRKGFGRFEITKAFNTKFDSNRSPNSIKHCIETYGAYIEKDLPRVLVVDIETQAHTVKTWGLFDQNIGLNQVVSDGGILCWSAKWLGEKEIFFKGTNGYVTREKQMLKPLWSLMNSADIILGQNSNKFDIKKINAKFLEYDFGRPSSYKKLDTLIISKRHFSFLSHKLEYMTRKFCKILKTLHSKFPGYSLWDECDKRNKTAWIEMENYNKQDILATEELFIKLAEFDTNETTQDAVRAYNAAKKQKK